MKFEHEKTISDVVRFDVNQHGLYYLSKDMTVFGIKGLNLNDEEFYSTDLYIPRIFLNGDFLCVTDAYSRCIVFDLECNRKCIYKNTVDPKNGFRVLSQQFNNRRILLRIDRKDDENIGTSIWNIDAKTQYPTSHKCSHWFDDGKYLFLIRKGFVEICRLSPTDTEIWTHSASFEENTTIRDVLGMHNGFLWLTNNAGRIYSLDPETGNVCHSLAGVGSTFKYMIEPEKNRLVALQDRHLCIVDIEETGLRHCSTDIRDLFDVESLIPNYFGMFSKPPLVDSHIIFPDIENAAIGVFDIDNAQVTWQHKMYPDKVRGTVKQMQYHDNVLYVRCSDNTLHLFNRVS